MAVGVQVSLVVAMDRNRLIGAGNGLPWRMPADLRHFKRITMGHPVVMGRRTRESIGRPLPGRANIVVSTRPGYEAPGALVAESYRAALEAAGARAGRLSDEVREERGEDAPGQSVEVMVIGGARLFEEALADAVRIHLTEIDAELEGDTWFPAISDDEWACVSREDFDADERNPWNYSFLVLERIPGALPAPLVQPTL